MFALFKPPILNSRWIENHSGHKDPWDTHSGVRGAPVSPNGFDWVQFGWRAPANDPTPPATAGVDGVLVLAMLLHPAGHGMTDHFHLVGNLGLILPLLKQANGLEVAFL
jgi:hypothetical protein